MASKFGSIRKKMRKCHAQAHGKKGKAYRAKLRKCMKQN
jgi:hypothetical protein